MQVLDSGTMGFACRVLFAIVLSFACSAQTVQKSSPTNQDLIPEQMAAVTKLANLQRSYGSKMNSVGVELVLKEIARWRASDRTFVKYGLYATGMPTNLVYSLSKVQISGKVLGPLLDGCGAFTPARTPSR